MKCAKCGNRWFQKPEVVVEQQVSNDSIPAHEDFTVPDSAPKPQEKKQSAAKKLPTVIKQRSKPVPFWITSLLVIFIFSSIVSAIFAYRNSLAGIPVLSSICSALGILPTEGLALEDVKVTKLPDDSKLSFQVQGKIANISGESRPIPPLRISIKDSSGDVVKGWKFRREGVLNAGETIPFETLVSVVSKEGETVNVDIGNYFEIFLRD